MSSIALLGIGNILECDDGIAVYACRYLGANYTFTPAVRIIEGGVEGINLLDVLIEHERVLILDAVSIEDAPGSIYHIPAEELTGYGLNGGAHEIGVIQCLDMLELMGKPLPEASILGIVPGRVEVHIGLSPALTEVFERYVSSALQILETSGITARPRETPLPLEAVIAAYRGEDGR